MKTLLVMVLFIFATGCTSVRDLGNGTYLVPRLVEVRSPFGTNAGFVWAEVCEKPAKEEGLQPLYTDPDAYRNCKEGLNPQVVYSQGQGGQVVSGLLQFGGLIGLGALMPAANQTVQASGNASASAASSSSSVSSSVSSIVNSGGKH